MRLHGDGGGSSQTLVTRRPRSGRRDVDASVPAHGNSGFVQHGKTGSAGFRIVIFGPKFLFGPKFPIRLPADYSRHALSARRSLDACLGCVKHTPTSRTAEWMHALGSAAGLTFCPHVVHTSNVVPTTWRVLSRRRLGVTVYVSYMGALLVISTLRHTC